MTSFWLADAPERYAPSKEPGNPVRSVLPYPDGDRRHSVGLRRSQPSDAGRRPAAAGRLPLLERDPPTSGLGSPEAPPTRRAHSWTRRRWESVSLQRRSGRSSSSSWASARSPSRPTSGATPSPRSASRSRSGSVSRWRSRGLGHYSGGHFNPGGVGGSRGCPEVPLARGDPVLDRAARRRLRRRARHRHRLLEPRRRCARDGAGGRYLERRCAPARDHRHRRVRHRHLHGRDRRPGSLEGRHGPAADRPLHLHGSDRGRPCVGRLVQPRPLRSRPRSSTASSATSGSTSSGRSSEASSAPWCGSRWRSSPPGGTRPADPRDRRAARATLAR